MKATKHYLKFIALILVVLTYAAYTQGDSSTEIKERSLYAKQESEQDNSKIIKFNHQLHVGEVGVKCEDCHTKVTSSISAKQNLNPLKKDCATCHDVNDQKECTLCHYENSYGKLRATDRELIFSHKLHTEKKKCIECHAGLDKVKFSKEAASVIPPMESCYTCHNDGTAMNECSACHTNLTERIPENHKSPNFLNQHTTVAGVSSTNANCMMCHTENFCQVCHSSKKYSGKNSPGDFFAPYYTKDGARRIDRENLQKLTTAHNINYRYTHGIDADQKSFECKTCHDPVEFCASCHQNGGEVPTGILPTSHTQNNFVTLGVNSGGGLHADLAKKDIESCQNCHDAQGADPACIKCHVDNDGVKGTNPRTHENGFLSDENGDWHSNPGSVCFLCHTDPNASPSGTSGRGFCGYCHGGGN
jgi:hypothetical protein